MRMISLNAALWCVFGLAVVTEAATLPAGLVLHLDASDPFANGGSSLPGNGAVLSTWNNKASGSLNATSSGSFRPQWFNTGGSNNTPIVRFDGADDRMTSGVNTDWTFLHDTTGSSVFVVHRLTDANPNALQSILSTDAFTTGESSYQLSFDDRASLNFNNMARVAINRSVSGSGVADIRANNSFSTQTWGLQSSVFGYQRPGSDTELFVNGTVVGTADFGTRTPDSAAPGFALHFGATAGSSASNFFKGDIAEILIFSGTLDSAEQEMVGSYLETKYLLGTSYPLLPVEIVPVPEPTTAALLGLGLLGLVIRKKRARG